MPCSTAHRPIASICVGRVHRPGRVARGDEHERARTRGSGRLELLDAGEVAGGLVGQHLDRRPAGQADGLGVRRPVRRRQQHLVARVQDRGERVVERLLAAVRHHDLGGGRGQPVLVAASSPRSPSAARAAPTPACSGGTAGRGRPPRPPRRCARGSGSPARRSRTRSTGRPDARIALARASIASVADAAIEPTRRETRRSAVWPEDSSTRGAAVMAQSCHRPLERVAAYRVVGSAPVDARFDQGRHLPYTRRLVVTIAVSSCAASCARVGDRPGPTTVRAVAQLAEFRSPKPAVVGSSPSCPA